VSIMNLTYIWKALTAVHCRDKANYIWPDEGKRIGSRRVDGRWVATDVFPYVITVSLNDELCNRDVRVNLNG
jgi:hypothetical protein